MLEDAGPLEIERQVDLEVSLQLMTPVVRAWTDVQVRARRYLNGCGKAEAIVHGLRQGIRQPALEPLVESFLEIDEQSLVTDKPEVRIEGVAGDGWIAYGSALSKEVRGSRNQVSFDGHHLVPATVIDEAHIEPEVRGELTPVSDRGIEVVRRLQIRIDRLNRRRWNAQQA